MYHIHKVIQQSWFDRQTNILRKKIDRKYKIKFVHTMFSFEEKFVKYNLNLANWLELDKSK